MPHTPLMRTSVSRYHRHRFPAEIISHCVWSYFRFALSFRDVEEMMTSRGVSLTYETVREWTLKFGQTYANGLRHKSPRPGDRWHLDEVFLKINGRLHYLWRKRWAWPADLNLLITRSLKITSASRRCSSLACR
jgi:putative transposase